MNKKLVIDKCDECPFFNNVYYGYEETCTLLDKKIKQVCELFYPIPNECPLETTDEKPTHTKF